MRTRFEFFSQAISLRHWLMQFPHRWSECPRLRDKVVFNRVSGPADMN
jgi:hypothetical protein